MEKNVIACVQELKAEVDMRYRLGGYKPDGMSESAFDIKLGILAEMYERFEELKEADENRDNKETAFCQLSELYHTCGSWN